MRRGTLVLSKPPSSLPITFNHNGPQSLSSTTILLNNIERQIEGASCLPDKGMAIDRYVGDLACDGRGEILILSSTSTE